MRNHGIDRDSISRFGPDAGWAYDMKLLGRNYRLTDIQAALGISQIKKIDQFIEKRRSLVACYKEMMNEIEYIELPEVENGATHVWHLFTILLPDSINRNRFFTYLRKNGIGVNVHYIPIYQFTYYKKNHPCNPIDYPVTEDVFKRIISLPLWPGMDEDQVRFIVDTIKKGYHSGY
jgi:dTDP-4-amino-4,6-dideoxygalactose transaminase